MVRAQQQRCLVPQGHWQRLPLLDQQVSSRRDIPQGRIGYQRRLYHFPKLQQFPIHAK